VFQLNTFLFRRTSNATDDVRILNPPKHVEIMPKLSTNSMKPSQSYPLFRKTGSSSVLNNPVYPTIHFEDYDSMLNVPPCSPNKFPCETEESEEELERCRLLAKLSGPRMSTSEMLQEDGTIRRKVSISKLYYNTNLCLGQWDPVGKSHRWYSSLQVITKILLAHFPNMNYF
jgi:hypothetical protein